MRKKNMFFKLKEKKNFTMTFACLSLDYYLLKRNNNSPWKTTLLEKVLKLFYIVLWPDKN